jgi:chromosome segregation ATPase
MHKLLEQSRQEKQRLSDEMNGKEAVWERLVTAKESYALRVQDMQVEITRLQDSLQLSQQHVTHLESQLTNQATISSPTAACSPITMHPENSTMVEQHYNRRIEKLDRLVREWQHDAQQAHQQLQQQQRTHNAQMDQLRRDLAERDQATATMERDCEAAKQANVDMIWHYETMLKEWNVDREKVLKAKDDHIDRLGQVIEELKACHFLLPPSPNNDDDDDDDDDDEDSIASIIPDLVRKLSLNATTTTTTTSKHNRMYSSRRRLEQQLELTTMALDEIQQQQKATLQENEQLRDQLSHMHAASSAMDQQCHQLQNELSKEINHKRLVMEERDAALQGQLRMDDEHEDLEMTNTRLELQLKQLEEERQDDSQVRYKVLQEAHDALEQECGRLMDQILSDDDHRLALEARIAQLEEAERQRVQQLERIETASLSSTTTSSTVSSQQRRRRSSKPIPFAMNHCSGIIMPDHQPPKRSSTSRVTSYCEICEVHGHDVLGCKALRMDGNSTIVSINKRAYDYYAYHFSFFLDSTV